MTQSKRLFLFSGVLIFLFLGSCKSIEKQTDQPENQKEYTLSQEEKQNYFYMFIEANRMKMKGNFSKAINLYYECLKIHPQSAASMYEISRINNALEKKDIALEYAENAVRVEPDNKWYLQHLAQLYIQSDSLKKAIAPYEKIVQIEPGNINYLFTLAQLYRNTGQKENAVNILDKIEDQTGLNQRVSVPKQRLNLELGNTQQAEEGIKQLIKAFPEEPKYYGMLADMYVREGRIEKAEELYQKVFQLDSTNALGQLSVLEMYRSAEEYEKVFEYLPQVILNKNLKERAKTLTLVSFLNNQKEFNRFYEEIRKNIELYKQVETSGNDPYTLMAELYLKNQEYNSAANELAYIVDTKEADYYLLEQLVNIYLYTENYTKAYNYAQKGIQQYSTRPRLYLFASVSAQRLGKNLKALEYLQQGKTYLGYDEALEIQFLTNFAEVHHVLGNHEKSDEYFELVLELDPDNLIALNNYSYYLSLRRKDLDKAADYSLKTVEAEPENSTYLDTYAWILYQKGDYKEALKYIKNAYANGGYENPEILEHYGDILFQLNEKKEALKYWKTALELSNNNSELEKKIQNISD